MVKNKGSEKKFFLRLYVTGNAPQSIRAILNIKRICEDYLKGNYDLEIIDIYKNPRLAKAEHIIAAPTLTKLAPGRPHRLIGDLSDEKKVLKGLQLHDKEKAVGKKKNNVTEKGS